MNSVLIENMVARPTPFWKRGLFYFLISLVVVNMLVVVIDFTFLLFACISGLLAFFLNRTIDIEFEYIYFEKELTIDKIIGQAKRKRQEKIDLNKMELFAPIDSSRLDALRYRDIKTLNYSCSKKIYADGNYAMYCDGKRILLTPSEKLINAIKADFPQKVFTD